METNAIEKYVIDKIENLEAENKSLIKDNEELAKELNTLKNIPDDKKIFSMPTLGIGYGVIAREYYIQKDNIEKYKEALKNKDFKWLEENKYEVYMSDWNYEIHIVDKVLKLRIGTSDDNLTVDVADPKYNTIEEAQNGLLKELEKDIAERERRFKEDE